MTDTPTTAAGAASAIERLLDLLPGSLGDDREIQAAAEDVEAEAREEGMMRQLERQLHDEPSALAEARAQGAADERERTDEAFRVALTAIRETSTDPSARDLAASLLALLLDEVSA